MYNLLKNDYKHFYCCFIFIVLCFFGCDDPLKDTVVSNVLNNSDQEVTLSTPYMWDASQDIKLQVPEHLIHIPSVWHPCPEGVNICHPNVDYFTDESITLSSCMAITEDRIYVADGSGTNIYAFNFKGEFMEDETLSRKTLGQTGHNISGEGTSPDRCLKIVTNGTHIYMEVRYTPFRGLINVEAIVSFDIASKSVVKVEKTGNVIDGHKNLEFATADYLYFTEKSMVDLFRAHDKYLIRPLPEFDIQLQHEYEGNYPIPLELQLSGNLSKAAIYGMALAGAGIFYDHDHQLIYKSHVNNTWGAFHLNGEYADIEFVSERWFRSPQYANNRVYFMERPREPGVKGDYYLRCYSK